MIIRTFSLHGQVPERFAVDGPVHAGGEGEIYFSRCGRFAIKLYHERLVSSERVDFLEKVLFLGRTLGEDARYLCWPRALVREIDGIRKTGVVTERIPRPPYRELVDYIFSPREFKRAVSEGIHWLNYLQVAHSLAQLVSVLHGKGCAHADLHFSNFLVDMKKGRAVLIDLDGLVVPGFLPSHVAGMMPFMAPEVISRQASPDQKTDRHSLAVLIFQTLLFRNPLQPLVCCQADDAELDEMMGWGREAAYSENSFHFRNRPLGLGRPLFRRGVLSVQALPPSLRYLFDRSFVRGLFCPTERPLAREWTRALERTASAVWPCAHCRQYFPYPFWMPPTVRRCPFCGGTMSSPSPVVCRVYRKKTSAISLRENDCIVLGPRYRLLEKMVIPGTGRLMYGEVLWQDHQYHFIPTVPVQVRSASWGYRKRMFREGEKTVLQRSVLLEWEDVVLEVVEDGQ